MSTVGILANPASGKDIRRLVAHGSVFDNLEKIRMVRRLILGIEQAGASRIVYMPDAYGTVPRALDAISPSIPVQALDMPVRNSQQDTTTAAKAMYDCGAGCLVVLGGDGTNRAACKGTVDVPLLPLSTGTNNVFPSMGEATIAGLAAGIVANGTFPIVDCCTTTCMFHIYLDETRADIALVDAAVYDDIFVGSRAVWNMDKVPQIFLTRCDPSSIGLSAVGGQLTTIRPEEPAGLALDLGRADEATVTAPIAPGLFATVAVSMSRRMQPGEHYAIGTAPGLIAVDGEREVDIPSGCRASIVLSTEGPKVVDVPRVMALASRHGLFTQYHTPETTHRRTV